MNILVDFLLNKGRKKKAIAREKHPGGVAQVNKFAALMKKRKEEILRNKKQSTEQSTVQYTEQSIVQSTEQSTIQATGQSNDTYVYRVGILAVLAIGVCVFFTFNKKAGQLIHKQPIIPIRRNML